MDFKEFVDEVVSYLPGQLHGEFEGALIKEEEVNVLQGQSYSGIVIIPENSDMGVSLNLNNFYQEMQTGTPFHQILQHIVSSLEENYQLRPEISSEDLGNYEKVKSLLTLQVVGKKKNYEMLQNVPSTDFLDMSIVYRLDLEATGVDSATILITNKMMENYGISVDKLHADALEIASQKVPYVIRGMDDLMSELIEGPLPKSVVPMYVASNEKKIYGAGVIAYPDFMEACAETIGGDFFLLPSSLHEVIILPDYGAYCAGGLELMVMEINFSAVNEEDRLTNSAYHYDSKEKVFELARTYEKRMKESGRAESKSVLKTLEEKKQENKERSTREPCRAIGHDSFDL